MLRDPRYKKLLVLLVLVAIGLWHHRHRGGAPLVAAPGQIRVLIVDEENDYATPAYKPYLNTLNSTRIIAYLNGHCAKDADGKTPAWRHWDKDVVISQESEGWQGMLDGAKDAMNKAGNTLPVVTLTNGHQTSTVPLPANEDDALALLATWGGK